MKSLFYTNIVAAAMLASSTAFSGIVTTFVPTEPVIESPQSGDVDVSKTASLTGSTLQALDSEFSSSESVVLEEAEWIFYDAESNIRLTGGQVFDSTFGNLSPRGSYSFDFPFNGVNFDNRAVTTVSVDQEGIVTLQDIDGVDLARVKAQLTHANNIDPATNDAFVAIKTLPNQLMIQFYQKSSASSPSVWSNTSEIIVTDSGQLALRLSNNVLSSDFYNLADGSVGCGISFSGSMTNVFKSLAAWKVILQADNTKFSLLCSENVAKNGIQLQTLTEADVINFDLPVIKKVVSTSTDYTLAANEALEAGKDYIAQLRYTAKAASDNSESPLLNRSAWSKPLSFTTVAAQTSYDVVVPSDLTFVVDEAQSFPVIITNNGSDAGSPLLNILLPYNFLNGMNGSVSDYFNIDMEGAECSVALIAEETVMSCSAVELAPGESLTYTATVTLRSNDVTQLKYRICDAINCESTGYTDFAIDVMGSGQNSGEGNGSSSSSSSSNSSSSSSGSSNTLFLALIGCLTMLRRRK